MIPNRLFTTIIALTISCNISLSAQDAAALQAWKSKDGRVIQAVFVKLDGEAVVVEKDGKEVTIPFAKLSAASVEQAKKAASSGNLTGPAPAQQSEPLLLPKPKRIGAGGLAGALARGGGGIPKEEEKYFEMPRGWRSTVCDPRGDLFVAVPQQASLGYADAIAKIAGQNGGLKWFIDPQDVEKSEWILRSLELHSSGDLILYGRLVDSPEGENLFIARISSAAGKLLWKHRVVGKINARASRFGFKETPDLFLPVEASGPCIVKLDVSSGDEKWRCKDVGADALVESVTDDRVFVRSGDSLACLSIADGKLLWRSTVAKEADLVVTNTTVAITPSSGNPKLSSLNQAGKPTWEKELTNLKHYSKYNDNFVPSSGDTAWIVGLYSPAKIILKGYAAARVGLIDGNVMIESKDFFSAPEPNRGSLSAIASTNGDLIAHGFTSLRENVFSHVLTRISGTDGTAIWNRSLGTVRNTYENPLVKPDASGDLLLYWQEETEGDDVISIVKLSGLRGETIWHQRIYARGGAGFGHKWTLDAKGDVICSFTPHPSKGVFKGGSISALAAIKVSGTTGAIIWSVDFGPTP